MLRQVLGAVARNEIQGLKRRSVAAAFGLASAFLISLALIFGFIGFFLWLVTLYQPWKAALIVGAVLLIGALALWLMGKITTRSVSGAHAQRNADMEAVFDEASAAMKTDEASLTAVSAALAVGFAIGRKISK